MRSQDMRATPAAALRGGTAADIMTDPRICTTSSTVLDAVVIIRDAGCGAIPVLDEGRTIGVVTDRDVAMALTSNPDLADRPVSYLMRRTVVAVRPDVPLDVVQAKLSDREVGSLVFIDSDNRLAGMMARADLVEQLTERNVGEVVAEVVGRSPSPGRKEEVDNGACIGA